MRADLIMLKRNLENQSPTVPPTVATLIAPAHAIVFVACDTEGYSVEECAQLPLMKDTFWVNYQKGQQQRGPYENGNQSNPSYNNNYPRRDAPYPNTGPPQPSGHRYVPLHQCNEQNNTRVNNNDHNKKRASNDQNSMIEQLFERQNQNINKNFDRLNEGITNLVKFMSEGHLPAQPVHSVDSNT